MKLLRWDPILLPNKHFSYQKRITNCYFASFALSSARPATFNKLLKEVVQLWNIEEKNSVLTDVNFNVLSAY